MRDKKKPSSRRLDFLPNRFNQYSIRKFTVGTASILIGATLIFGINTEDAKAAEQDTADVASSGETGETENTDPTAADVTNTSDLNENDPVLSDELPQAAPSEVSNTTQLEAEGSNESVSPDLEEEKTTQSGVSTEEEIKADVPTEPIQEEQSTPQPDIEPAQDKLNNQQPESESTSKEITPTDGSDHTPLNSEEKKEENSSQIVSDETPKTGSDQSGTVTDVNNTEEPKTLTNPVTQEEVSGVPEVKSTSSAVTTAAKQLNVSEQILEEVVKASNIDITQLSEEDAKDEVIAAYLATLATEKEKYQPKATLRHYGDTNELNSPFRITPDDYYLKEIVGLNEINKFNQYGTIENTMYDTAFLNDNGQGYKQEPALKLTPNTSRNGVLELKTQQFDFTKDFELRFKVANFATGKTNNADGFAFLFTQASGQEVYNQGSILNNTGVPNSGGFKIDTSHTTGGPDGTILKGSNNEGYASFVKSDASGTSVLVGDNPDYLNKRLNNLPDKRFPIFQASTVNNESTGQRLIPVIINYDATNQEFTAEYQKKSYIVSLSDLGLIQGQAYNFDIASTVDVNGAGERKAGESIIQVTSIAINGEQADDHTPNYDNGRTIPGKPVTMLQTGDNTLPTETGFSIPEGGVPAGWTATIDPNNGTLVVTPPADAQPGDKADIPVTVTYPDGSVDNLLPNVTVVANNAQDNTPSYNGGNTKPNTPVEIPQTGDTDVPDGTQYEVPNTPNGWTVNVNPDNGTVTATPPADATPGTEVDIPVKVTYPDGSTEDTTVKVTVTPNDAQDNTPGYNDGSTKPNVPVEIPQTGDTDVPGGTKYEVPNTPDGWTVNVNPDNGTVIAIPPADAEPGTEVDIPVKVTYPDGSTEDTTVKVTVTPNDAQDNTPGYNDGNTKPNVPVEIPQTGDTDVPGGTKYEVPNTPDGWTVEVNPDNGTVTATPPADAEPGTEVDIPVKVTYPDGSTEDTTVKVTVTPNDAQDNTPGYNDGSTKPNVPVEIPQTGDADVPPGTKYEVPEEVPTGWTVEVNPDNGTVTATPPADAIPGTEVDIPVKVTYPDGSTETPSVKVTVTPNDAQDNTPGYNDGSTKPNVPVEIPQTGDIDVPGGTKYEVPNTPDGWTVEVNPDNGTVTATPPADAEPGTEVDIPVKVTYPDGSTEGTTVKVTVTPNDAQDNTPGYNDGSTKPNVLVEIPQTGDTDVPPGTKYEVPEEVPTGWTVEVNPDNGTVTVTPPADAEPGTEVDIPVKVTYPDGSTEDTTVKVTVTPNDAQDNTPGYDNGSTKPNVPVEIPQTGDTDVPTGTQYEIPEEVPTGWTVEVNPDNGTVTATPPADATPGTEVDIPVKVTYPDGSTETPSVKVTVDPKEEEPSEPEMPEEPGKEEPNEPQMPEEPGKEEPSEPEMPEEPGKEEPSEPQMPEENTPSTDEHENNVPNNNDKGDSNNIDMNTPSDDEHHTTPSITIDMPQIGNTRVPSGVTCEVPSSNLPQGWDVEVQQDRGVLVVTPPAETPSGTVCEFPVKMTYPNGMTVETPVKVVVDAPVKDDATQNETQEMLPETGHESQNTTLLGSLLAGLGLTYFFRRRRKEDK
ncbi:YPDG domain-containing protein [Staphylococcus sp. 11262D007BW]